MTRWLPLNLPAIGLEIRRTSPFAQHPPGLVRPPPLLLPPAAVNNTLDTICNKNNSSSTSVSS